MKKDSEGNPNYGLDTSGKLCAGKMILRNKRRWFHLFETVQILSAKAGAYQDETTGANENVVELCL